jgi:hypothetical protein
MWCKNNAIDPLLAAELRCMVDRRARQWARTYKHSPQSEAKLAEKFKEAGITNVSWPGLFPVFTTPNGQREVMLPDV